MSMFVCPECGYHDDPCWRSHRQRRYSVYCHIDELKCFRPKLAERLRKRRIIEEEPYCYRLGKTGYVERMPLDLKQFLTDHRFTERYIAALDPNQQRISRYVKS